MLIYVNKRYNLSQTKKSNFTANMFGVQSHKNKAGATYSSGTAMAEPVFWLNNTFQF